MEEKQPKTEAKPFREPDETKLVVARPSFIDRYLEVDKEIKTLTKEKEELRAQLIIHLRDVEHYEDIYWKQTKPKPKLDPVKIYNDLKDKLPPEVLEEVTTTTKKIESDGLEALFLGHYIEKEIPQEWYTENSPTDAIEIPENRKRNK